MGGGAVRRLMLAAMMLSAALATAARAQEFAIGGAAKPPYLAKTFAVADDGGARDVKLKDATVSLIGEPDSKSFGVSYRGTVDPETEITESPKLVGYFYVNCDNEPPSKTKGLLVGSVSIADIKQGRDTYTLIATADATAFVPLKSVQCVKVGVR